MRRSRPIASILLMVGKAPGWLPALVTVAVAVGTVFALRGLGSFLSLLRGTLQLSLDPAEAEPVLASE